MQKGRLKRLQGFNPAFSDDLGYVLGFKHRVRAYRTHPTPDAQLILSDTSIRLRLCYSLLF